MQPVQQTSGDREAGSPGSARAGPGQRTNARRRRTSGADADGRTYGRTISIHVVVLTLVIALVLPAVGFLTYIVWTQSREQERALGARAAQIAGEIADRLDQEFTTLETILAVFATSGWLENDELALLHRRATAALAGSDRHLIVLDPDMQQLLNTRVPFGTALGKTSDPETAMEVMETGEPAISNLFQGRVAGTGVFNVLRRATMPDGRERVLILTRNADSLAELFGSSVLASGWSFAVLDGAGQIVTTLVQPGEAERVLPAACHAGGTQSVSVEPDGEVRHVAQEGVNGTGWSVCAWAKLEHLSSRMERSWTALLTGTMVWLGAALLAAVLLSASISRAIASTARVGEALEAGREVAIPTSFITEVDEVRRYLAAAAAERIRKDQQLQLLLRETAHRAKNQLALAVSLIGLSARNASSADDLKENLTGRLLALGRSIDAVTGGEFDAAPLGELIRAQLEPFVDDEGDRFEMRGPTVPIPEKTAQSLSLVLHELATNASKYGAWSRPTGSVRITWQLKDEVLTIDWRETASAVAAPERRGFGTKLVDTLVGGGLGGSIDRTFSESGFSCRVTIPLARVGPAA